MENRIGNQKEVVDQKFKDLFEILKKQRGTPILQRFSAYVVQQKGKGIQEYIQNGAPLDEKEALIDELIAIAEAEDWDKLPPAPGGQATAPVAKPAPAPKPMQPAAPDPAPAPEPEARWAWSLRDEILTQAEADEAEEEAEEEEPEVSEHVPEAATQLAALIAKLAKPATTGGSITEDRVREIVREELRSAFSSLL